jgi:hypothetical protein
VWHQWSNCSHQTCEFVLEDPMPSYISLAKAGPEVPENFGQDVPWQSRVTATEQVVAG